MSSSSQPSAPDSRTSVSPSSESQTVDSDEALAQAERRRLKGKGRARHQGPHHRQDADEDEDPRSPASPTTLLNVPSPTSSDLQEYPPTSQSDKESRAVEEVGNISSLNWDYLFPVAERPRGAAPKPEAYNLSPTQYLASLYKTEKTRRASIRRSHSSYRSNTRGSSPSSPSNHKHASPNSSIFRRMSSRRKPEASTSNNSIADTTSSYLSSPKNSRVGMVRMPDMEEEENEELAQEQYRRSHSASSSTSRPAAPALSINTDVGDSASRSFSQSQKSDTSRKSQETTGTTSSGSMTPVERAIKRGSRFTEDIPRKGEAADPALAQEKALKRHSAPTSEQLQPQSPNSNSSGKNRFRLSLQTSKTSSSSSASNIFQSWSPSRSSLQMINLAPGTGDLGEGPRPLPTPTHSIHTSRSSWYFDGGESSHNRSSYTISSPGEAGVEDESGQRTPTSDTATSGQQQQQQQQQQRERRMSINTEVEGLPIQSQRKHDGAATTEHDDADAREMERRAKGQGERWKARQEMGWVQWFCCLGCIIEAEEEDDEAQTGRTGPDLL